MSKADELFKELGYEINKNPSCQSYELFYVKGAENENEPFEYIVFHKNRTITTVCNDRNYVVVITLELLKAINKKVQELGWNKDRTEYFKKYYKEVLKPKRKKQPNT